MGEALPDWRCPACGEEVPGGFDACWNCGADQAGKPDPTFVPVQAVVIPAECEWCGYSLVGLEGQAEQICPECGEAYDRRRFEPQRRGTDVAGEGEEAQ